MTDSMIIFGRGQGRLARATRKWADSLTSGADSSGSVLILVELAQDAAKLADGARKAEDGRLYLSAASRLEALVARAEKAAGRDRGPVEGDDAGGVDDLADVMGSGPEVRDTEV